MQLDPVRVWRAIKPYVPTRLYRYIAVVYRQYVRALVWYHERRPDPPGSDGLPLPPASMRHRVIGVAAAASFAESIPKVRADLARALARVGRSLDEFHSILDFGSGCGRGLRAFAGARDVALCGTDIDAEAVAWCKANLPFARWEVNGALPPLAFADAQFDLVYSISVFTHLDEQKQFAWLVELRRVARPGAILLLTVHGAAASANLPRDVRGAIERDGFLYLPSFADKGRFPDWYQNAYHTEAYVRRTFGRYFKLLDYLPAEIYGQDLVVLERASD
jgi:SAM-dependent methyltransferase